MSLCGVEKLKADFSRRSHVADVRLYMSAVTTTNLDAFATMQFVIVSTTASRRSRQSCATTTTRGVMMMMMTIIIIVARSTGTLHTSAKARLTSVAISVPPSGESVYVR